MKCIPNKRQSAWLQTGRVRATAACTSKHSQKIFMLQSAMEYLMTYGWAILILTVVIGALYSMGIFGSTTSAPRAQPGSCRVFRPNGPGTTAYINLEGVCTGQLPQFVATFSGSNKKVTVPANPNWNANSLTVSVWFYATSQAVGVVGTYNQGTNWGIWVSNPPSRFEVMDGPSNWQSPQIQLNTWYDAVYTRSVSGSTATMNGYLNGVLVDTISIPSFTGWSLDSTQPLMIGSAGQSWNFIGQISNVQIYNTSLDANAIQNLYVEGVGGAPIPSPYLMGWWPLNGDAKDYSGNNNNGAATSITYTSTWTSGYQGN